MLPASCLFLTAALFEVALLEAPGDIAPPYARYEYFRNPWDCVGLKDYPDGIRIAPDRSVHLPGKRVLVLPLKGRVLRFLEEGCLPILHLRTQSLEAVLFATPLDIEDPEAWSGPEKNSDFLLVSVLSNRSQTPLTFDLKFQGFGALESTSTSSAMILKDPQGRAAVVLLAASGRFTGDRLSVRLGPGDSARIVIPSRPRKKAAAFSKADFPLRARRKCYEFWKNFLSSGAFLYVPEPKARHAWYASVAGNFIARDRGTLKPGEGFYDSFYLRDGAFQLVALTCAGYRLKLRSSLKDFLASQKPDGRFESQRGELDGNGQALWALWSWWRLTRDEEFIKRVWPAIERSVRWIEKARLSEKPPFRGILPRSLADGEFLWKGDCHIVGYDFWNLRGVACAADIARALGRNSGPFDKLYREYKESIEKLLKERGFDWFPPSYEGRGTSWGNLTAVYPTELFAPRDPRVTATLNREKPSFIEGTIRWRGGNRDAIHPYLSTYITQSEIIRGEVEQAVDHFYHFLCHSSATNAFPEGVYWKTRTAWNNTLPHQWAAAQYLLLLRNMLLREERSTLHFLSAVPSGWLAPGKKIVFRKAPTRLGLVSFSLKCNEGGLKFDLSLDRDCKAEELLLHLPPGLKGRRSGSQAGFSNPIKLPVRSGMWTIEFKGKLKESAGFLQYARKYAETE